jgi:hypothetical protein
MKKFSIGGLLEKFSLRFKYEFITKHLENSYKYPKRARIPDGFEIDSYA